MHNPSEKDPPMLKETDTQSNTAGIRRRDFIVTSGAAVATAALGTIGLPTRLFAQSAKTQITFASARFFATDTMQQVIDKYNKSQNSVQVTYIELPPPSSSTEVHQQLVQQLARKNGTPDVFTQDIIWIAEFAEAGWALPLDSYFGAEEMKAYFPGIVQGCTWRGKLTAMPWFIDCGKLYYRKDILEKIGATVPETWEQLIESAQKGVGGDTRFGFIWQGKQAEILTCDLVSFVGSNGGSILGPDGKSVKIADPEAKAAVQLMYDTINKYKITPSDVLSWDEEPSRRPFTAGQSVFLRNWNYVWSIAQDKAQSEVVDKVDVAPLPHFAGKQSAACLGGYQYGINAFSKNKEAAVDFLRWLSTPETQLHFATVEGFAPTRQAVFDEPELAKTQPFIQKLKPVFLGALPRPVTPKYPQVTLVLQSEVSNALVKGDVSGSLDRAKAQIEKIVAS
jgi:multiple sugar transport system substrate-binding protein